MPSALACVPRKMLPPPITTPISAPSLCSDWISSVNRSTTLGEMPKPCSPARASPLSFSTTRRYFSVSGSRTPLLAELKAGEAADDDVLASLRGRFLDQLLDRLLAVLRAHEHLIQQRVVLIEAAQLTLHDLVVHVRRLAFGAYLLQVDGTLALDNVLRQARRVERERIRRRNVHRQIARQPLEHFVARDEIGLALNFHQHADLATHVHVTADRAFARLPLAPLRRLRRSARTQQIDRCFYVSVRFLERFLALHHPRPRALAQLLHLCRTDRHLPPLSRLTATAPAAVPALLTYS